jgi:hypothetical protein
VQKVIKIYGERNTATNYFSQLLHMNFEIFEVSGTAPPQVLRWQERLPGAEWLKDLYFSLSFERNLGWKHSQVAAIKKIQCTSIYKESELCIVTLTKNPYAWLLSLYKQPYHNYQTYNSFLEFLTNSWDTVGRDNIEGSCENPIQLWNKKNRSYIQLTEIGAINLKTEDLNSNTFAVLELLKNKFLLKKKTESYKNQTLSSKGENKNSDDYKSYYVNEQWREKISREEIAVINKTIDTKIMSHFGYKIL